MSVLPFIKFEIVDLAIPVLSATLLAFVSFMAITTRKLFFIIRYNTLLFDIKYSVIDIIYVYVTKNKLWCQTQKKYLIVYFY